MKEREEVGRSRKNCTTTTTKKGSVDAPTGSKNSDEDVNLLERLRKVSGESSGSQRRTMVAKRKEERLAFRKSEGKNKYKVVAPPFVG